MHPIEKLQRESHDLAKKWGLYEIAAWSIAIVLVMAATRYLLHLDPLVVGESGARTCRYLGCGYLILWTGASVGIVFAARRRYRHEVSLKNSEDKFRTVCDWMQDWEFWSDPSGQLRYMSPSCEQVTGYAPADFYCNPGLVWRLVHPLDLPAVEEHLRGDLHEGDRQPVELVFRIVNRQGAVRWIDHRCRPVFDGSGGYHGRRVSQRDITEQKRLEEQLRHSQKMDAIGQLAGGVAHDFNNLLTIIHGYGSMVWTGMLPDDPHREKVEQILAASERAAKLTRGLLAFSRKEELLAIATDLNGIIRGVEKFLQRIIGEDVTVSTRCWNHPLTICANGGQIEQILLNLAVNARDAMPHGGELSVVTESVELDEAFVRIHGYGEPGRYALLVVSDTGLGMDPETRQKIFEPFFTTKPADVGTGLGLSIVFGIVKQHGGQISVYSEPGKGTSFRILLPLTTQDAARPPQAPGPLVGGTETILVAEDDRAVRSLMAQALGEFGYRILSAADGQEAVEVCRSCAEEIHLVLMDVIMPRKSGMEAYREIKKLLPDIKVLFTSGYPADLPHSRAASSEGRHLLSKPVAPSDLARTVRAVLDEPA